MSGEISETTEITEEIDIQLLLQTMSDAKEELSDIMTATVTNGASHGRQKLCELALKLGMISYE